ncbi:E3 ubiquitin-protein ligase RNF26 isoform X1 [Tachysurus fulvidraco]|uniref:E3 ubiquitin-protein ligase RNF26 isoform X1 n=2 Tax=Tachysurus fulvidraco TaxID=1234273 RepID=UPI000F50DF48|nr:E3 ubiquitin-protein ligase RNF26 isoform X1 [Tachysurus fulvidraco]
MGLLPFVFSAFGKCFDLVCLLLDLNFMIVNSLVRLFAALLQLINSFPVLLMNSLVECVDLSLFYLITMMDGMTVVTHNVMGGWMQLLGGVLESCKMMGYLSTHLLLRTKELLHRGLLSGQGFLRQICEGCGIVFSLLLYFINTVINLLLIGTQNLYTVLLSMIEAVASPLQKVLELALTVLTFFYSSLVGTSLLLWTPCRLAVEFLSSLGHLLISVFLLNSYGLLLTVAIILSATIYLNPALCQSGVRQIIDYVNTAPALQRLQRTWQRLFLLERHLWQGIAWVHSRLGLWMTFAGRGTLRAGDETVQQVHTDQDPPDMPERAEMMDADAVDEPLAPPPAPELQDQPQPGCGSRSPLQKMPSEGSCKAAPAENLLTLLQEQEERKKCVICQDSTKTVVLLPCRHLCLCRDCTDILLRQPVYQHNCPLCRHMILQTMDVYL